MADKNIWQKFNPSLKEMIEEDPKMTILGVWWVWYWRLIVLIVVIGFCFVIIAKLLS